MTLKSRIASVLLLLVLSTTNASAAIVLGSADTFQDGSTEGWSHGKPSSFEPTNVANEGPWGGGDNALGFSSSGTFSIGSRFLAFNIGSDWTGDYIAAGVTAIRLDVRNTGATDLHLRLAFHSTGADFTTNAMTVGTGTGWQSLLYDIRASSLIGVGGSTDPSATLSAVTRIQVFSAVDIPTLGGGGLPKGDVIAASALFDNITATTVSAVPEPASAFFLLATLSSLTLVRKRR